MTNTDTCKLVIGFEGRDYLITWRGRHASVGERNAVLSRFLNHDDGGRAISEFDEVHDVEFGLGCVGCSD